MSEEFKVSIPMFEVGELETFDNNIHSIVEEYSKLMFKEKDQILTQRIIMKQEDEIERLHSIIKRLEKELFGMYVDIAGWDEDYAKKLIKKIEDSSQECELLKNSKKDVSIKSDELKCQFSDIWEYGDR